MSVIPYYELLVLVSVFLAVLNSMGLVLSSFHCFKYRNRAHIFILSTAGWLLGYFIEGSNFSLPKTSLTWIYLIPPLIVSVLTFLNYPTSITQLYVSTLLGYSLATNFLQGLRAVAYIVFSWISSFALGLFLSMLIRETLARTVATISITRALLAVKVVSLAYVFLTSYVLGGNLLGAIISLLGVTNESGMLLLLAAAVALSVYMSLKSRISFGLVRILFPTKYLTSLIPYSVSIVLTQVANRLGLPIIMSLVMFSSTLGVGLSSKLKIFHRKRILIYIVASYIGPFILSMALSFLLASYLINRQAAQLTVT